MPGLSPAGYATLSTNRSRPPRPDRSHRRLTRPRARSPPEMQRWEHVSLRRSGRSRLASSTGAEPGSSSSMSLADQGDPLAHGDERVRPTPSLAKSCPPAYILVFFGRPSSPHQGVWAIKASEGQTNRKALLTYPWVMCGRGGRGGWPPRLSRARAMSASAVLEAEGHAGEEPDLGVGGLDRGRWTGSVDRGVASMASRCATDLAVRARRRRGCGSVVAQDDPAVQRMVAGVALRRLEHVACEAFFEQVGAVQAGGRCAAIQASLRLLAVGEVLGVLPQGVAGPLDRCVRAGGRVRRGRSWASWVGVRGSRRSAAFGVQGVGGPGDHVERIGGAHRVRGRAAATTSAIQSARVGD